MNQSSRIKFNPVTHEVEIEGSEAFVAKYFDIIQSMLTRTPAKTKEKISHKKRGPKKAAAATKPAKNKKPKKLSMTDKVIALVQQSPGGITVDKIIKKTKVAKQQAWNILSTAKKEGRIGSIGRGVYRAV